MSARSTSSLPGGRGGARSRSGAALLPGLALLAGAALGWAGPQDGPTSRPAAPPGSVTEPDVATPGTGPGAPPPTISRPDVALATWDVLPNGDFEDPLWEGARFLGTELPWWRAPEGRRHASRVVGGVLEVAPGAGLERPAWWWPPSRDVGGVGFVLRGVSAGDAALELVDGEGSVVLPLAAPAGPGGGLAPFELSADDVAAALGRPLGARFTLRLLAGEGGARFDDLALLVDLPDPDPATLAAELVAETDRVLDLVTAHGLDRVGPRETDFVVATWDVVTGTPLRSGRGAVGVFHESLLELHASDAVARRAPELHARAGRLLERHVPEFLELTLHPTTHLPRLHDPLTDLALDRPIEASRYLGFLLDLASHGPEALRADCRAAAAAFGEAVLAGGVVPTGEVASRYAPETGVGDTQVPSIRKLDMPAELVRLGVLLDDERYLATARAALSEYEYLHMWGGTWDSIDPGLDDVYGHFGNRSVTMAKALPGEPLWLRLGASGLDHYGPMWRRTLAHGAFVAADQVRGWKGFVGVAELEPARRAEVAELLSLAVAAHLVGELDTAGRWVDVSHHRWEPRFGLEVGDVPGVPGNLLEGLAHAARLATMDGSDAGGARAPYLDPRFLRGAFLAVLRTTEETYGRPYGLLPMRSEGLGENPSGADLRLLGPMAMLLGTL